MVTLDRSTRTWVDAAARRSALSKANRSDRDGQAKRGGDVGPQAIRLGTTSARQIVVTTKRIVDEMAEGARVVVGQRRPPTGTAPLRGDVGVQAGRRSAGGGTPPPAATGTGTSNGQGDIPSLIGQFVDLAQQVAQVFTDAASRLVEVGAGPLERLVDPDATVIEDLRVVLGPVAGGNKATGAFLLRNSAAHDAEVGVVLTNSLASMDGVIPLERVVFDPARANVPGNGEIEIAVTVGVPKSTPSGRYLGIVRSDEVPGLTLVLEVDVA